MESKISPQAKGEILQVLRKRYQAGTKKDKARILDEYVELASCHRKHAIRILRSTAPSESKQAKHGLKIYSEAVRQAVIVLWEASDRIWGKRLKSILPELLESLERHKHLNLDPSVRQLVLAVSAATIDRMLKPIRSTVSLRKKRKQSTKSSKAIPVRTFADWKDPAPGFLEIDFVSHRGTSMQGVFIWSLVATDVCTGWTEMIPLVAREQSLVVEGLGVLRKQFPMPIRGIDSDNDSAFINETLLDYCKDQKLKFTRSRAYQKNDQAWIEQKNGSIIRRFVGYERLTGLVAAQCLSRLYQVVRRFVNYFQPSFKLKSKIRIGAKIQKQYHPPATPCERLLVHELVSSNAKEELSKSLAILDPVHLIHEIREGQGALAAIQSGNLDQVANRISLEEFLAKLPQLWREGEVRPTHRAIDPSGKNSMFRHWRTRKDPFEKVWPEILLWLQVDPDATGKCLLERLQKAYPNQFPKGQIRTLQRRIKQWRAAVDRSLVTASVDGMEEQPVVVGGESFATLIKFGFRQMGELDLTHSCQADKSSHPLRVRGNILFPLRHWHLIRRSGRFPPLPYPPFRLWCLRVQPSNIQKK